MIHSLLKFGLRTPTLRRTSSAHPAFLLPSPAVNPMRRSFEFARGGYLPTSEMSRTSNGDSGAAETRERVNELELGLSLGRGVRRIVTAEDFPSRRSRDSPISSNSSVSSSSGVLGDEAGEGDGGGSFRRAEAVGYNGTRSANSARLVLKKMMNGHFLWDVGTVNSQEQKSHSQVVGWPPIRTLRRNNLVNISRVANSDIKATAYKEISQSCSSNAGKKGVGGNDGERKAIHLRKFHFVKVNMDGDPIGRKVDLHTHVSYEALALALEAMFHKPTLSLNASTNGMFSKLLDGSSEFSLIYEDEDGDWMLVGDVPWGMFLCTVKRLRIMKTMDNCGLDESVNAEARLFRPLKSSVPF